MRQIFTSLALFTAIMVHGQKSGFEIGAAYQFSVPQGTMKQNMKMANGLGLTFYYTPVSAKYDVGVEISVNGYGYDKTRQTYSFEDGSTAPMDIIVSNNFYNFLFSGRHFFGNGAIRPFVVANVGYSLYSTGLNIYDPDEWDHCSPVDSEVLKSDGTFIFGAGGGIRWDMLPRKNPGRFYLNLSSHYTSGGYVSYMNANAPNHNHSNQTSDVYARFVNTQTQMVHEHHVGNVYSSLIELVDFRFGIAMKIGQID